MATTFSIDGREYNVNVLSIKRKFQVLDTENTERLTSGDMVRDIIGTFYNYSVTLDCNLLSVQQYDQMYEVLSAPTEFHNFVMPYGQSTYTFKGYVSSGEDDLKTKQNGKTIWNNLTIEIIAKAPKRRP